MAKDTAENSGTITEDPKPVAVEREVECVYVSAGVYKYIYADTKEDVV